MIMKTIIATSAKYGERHVLVDDDDFEELNKLKWILHKSRTIFYAARKITVERNKKVIMMHRVIMKVTNPSIVIDHINHNSLDNCKSNLRECTIKQNAQNRTSQRNSSSKYLGVHWDKNINKWRAQIKINNKQNYLGCFYLESDAAKAYNEKAAFHYGEYANLNVID